jgi:ribosomal protein S14
MIERNNKRKRMAKKYAPSGPHFLPQRNEALSNEERFKARLKFAELPRNGRRSGIRNRCGVSGRPRGYYRKLNMSRIALARAGLERACSGHGQVELVGDKRMNDPLGDMLTRIRNAQMRGKATVVSPSSKLRIWVLDVLQEEGYIRGYSEKRKDNGTKKLKSS